MKVPAIRLVPQAIESEVTIGLRHGDPEVGYRHRIGGEPPASPAVSPVCSTCSETMTYYGQLDSVNDDVIIGDAGLILVYLCFDCFEAGAVVAST